MTITSKIRTLINAPKKWIIRRTFLKNCLYNDDGSTIRIGLRAKCNNFTGNPSQIFIGKKCDINGTLSVQAEGCIKIGDYTTIRYDSLIGAVDRIEIGNHVIISNNVRIYDNNNHPTDPQKRIEMCEAGFDSEMWQWHYSEHRPVVIEDNVWIGEKAVILKGVKIGKGAVVGCNSVVTHDVDPYTIVAGNPAVRVKQLR